MTRSLALGLAALLAGALLTAGPATASSTPSDADLRPFARTWTGHTRSLVVNQRARALARVYSGCCDHVIDVRFRVLRASGNTHRGRVRAKVTRVRLFEPRYVPPRDRPHRGDVVVWTVRQGVLSDPATGTIYCGPRAARRGVCGA